MEDQNEPTTEVITFNKLHEDTKCDCVKSTNLYPSYEFVRRLRKDTVEERDFLSHWERGLYRDKTACKDICSVKGVSINYFLKDFEDKILAKYRTTFSINPKKGAFYLKFKLSVKEGRVKHMPESGDDSHYNLLKADSFNLANLEIIDTVKFA